MVNDKYLTTLNWLAENNISLSKDELRDLKARIETADYNDITVIPYDEAFSILGDIDYELDNLNESYDSMLFESANSDIAARFKQIKQQFALQNKEYKKNLKANQYVAASKNLDNMNKILAVGEKDIRSIDASSLGSKAGGFFRAFGLQLIIIAISGFITAKAASKFTRVDTIGNDGRAKFSGFAFDTSGNKIKDTASKLSIPAAGLGIGASLANIISTFRQASKDEDTSDIQQRNNSGNLYREKVLLLIKELRKEIARKQALLNRVSKKKDNEMIDDEDGE